MAKIIEIDLEKNIVIPINEPFSKEQLIKTLADYWEYEKGQEKVLRKEFKGSFDDFKKEFDGKKYSVLSSDDEVVVYDILEKMPYELSKTEWVIQKYLKPSTDLAKSIIAEIQTKEQKNKLQALQEEIKATKEDTLKSLEALSEVKLS
jgi:hypothetical protein